MKAARIVLVAVGVLLIGIAGGLLTASVPIGQWPAILLWLVVAVLLHDAVLSPLLLVAGRLLHRAGRRLPWAAIGVVQAGLVVGAGLTLVAVPAIRSQQLGARNSSVLVFPYGLHLAVAWAVIGIVTTVVVLVLARRAGKHA